MSIPSPYPAATKAANAPQPHEHTSVWPLAALVAVTSALYFAFAISAIYFSKQPGDIATLWYANAIAISALLARRPKDWPALLAGFALANVAANLVIGDTLWLTALFLPANLAEILFAGYLLRRFCDPNQCVNSPEGLLKALVLGGLVPALLGAFLGAATLSGYGLGSFQKVWFSWFEGSAVGSVSALPLGVLIVARGWRAAVAALRRPEISALLVGVLAVSLVALMSLPSPYVYISVSLVLLAVVGRFAAAAIGVLLCSVGVGTLLASGVFQPPPRTGFLSEAIFYLPLLLTLVPSMLLASAVERVQENIQQLAANEERFRTLYEKTPAMMHSIDTEGRLVSVSETWLRRLGYEKTEVLGRKSTEFLTPESRQYAAEVVLPNFIRDGFVTDIDYQMVTKRGEIFDVMLSAIWERDNNGRPLHTLAVMKDVTESKRLAQALAAEQELIEVTLHSIGDGVVTTDALGHITYLNPVAESLVGWTNCEVKGQAFSDIVHLFDEDSGEPLLNPVEKCLQDKQTYGLPENATLMDRHGKEYGVKDSVAPILSRDGSLLGAVMVFQDVTEARGLAQKMSYLAHHDVLTDLPNRVLFQDRVHQACQFGQRNHDRFAVIFMDLDHFKHVNDSLGHAAGDELLRIVARRLTSALRGSDTVCRLGGDEFVMLLTALDTPEDAGEVAKKILQKVALPCILAGSEVHVSVSLGIAVYPEDGDNPEILMRHADAAMYRSKRVGRNRYHFFSKSVDDAAPDRLQFEADIRRGLVEG